MSTAEAGIVRGPLPTRIGHPLALATLLPSPRRAVLLAEGANEVGALLHYSSLFELQSGGGERVAFDGELLRPALRWRHGVDADNEFELELAWLYATSGFLDHFVTEFHELSQFADGGRTQAEDNQFAMFLRKGGQKIFEVEEDELLLADLPLTWVRRLQAEQGTLPALALRVNLELPIGDSSSGAGNGGLDYGLGLLAEKTLGRLSATASLDWVHPERPDDFVGSGVELSERVILHHGWEYRWNAQNSLLLQISWMSRLTSDFELEEINREILDIGLGWAWDIGPGARWLCSLHEDAVAATGPDVSFFSGLLWQF